MMAASQHKASLCFIRDSIENGGFLFDFGINLIPHQKYCEILTFQSLSLFAACPFSNDDLLSSTPIMWLLSDLEEPLFSLCTFETMGRGRLEEIK